MATFFKASDVIGAAVQMEQRGHAVYRRLAESSKDAAVKAFFENLASEELRHEEIFAAMAKRVGAVELPAWSSTEEFQDYVGALLDSHALFAVDQADALFADANDLQKAVQASMKLEKDSMLFFIEMQKLVPPSEQKAVEHCIDEERKHMRQLASLIRK